MDQYSHSQVTTRPMPEGDSRDVASAASASTATVSNRDTGCFDFFSLPRELRDKIYEQPVMFEYEHLPTTSPYDWITKAKKLRTSLLRVSRQFRDEYVERCASKQVLYMRDHCSFAGSEAISLSSDRARSWVIEFYVVADEQIIEDLEMLKEFLDIWAASDRALHTIDISLLFVGASREEIESCRVRYAISELQALERVDSLDVCLAEKLWDFRKPGTPKIMIAHWERGDDMHIEFLTPASEIHGKASEWGHQGDIVPECCDPFRVLESYSDSEVDEENGSDGESDGGEDSGSDNDGEDDDSCRDEGRDREGGDDGDEDDHDAEDLESVDGTDDEISHTILEKEALPSNEESDSNFEDQRSSERDAEEDDDDEDGDHHSEATINEHGEKGGGGDQDVNTEAEADQVGSYFDFFGLSPEIRDMIYDQPQMLDQETLLCRQDDQPGIRRISRQMAATRPRTSLLMVNSQFSSEYEKRCEGRSGLFISKDIDEIEAAGWIPPKAANEASFMHIHVGEWADLDDSSGYGDLDSFESWLSHWTSRMPKLASVTINLYVALVDIEGRASDVFIRPLDGLTSVSLITELRLIVMEDASNWRSKHAAKQLLVHWKRGDNLSLQVLDPAVHYEEDCCDGTLALDLVPESEPTHSIYESEDSEEEDEEMSLFWDTWGD